MSRLYLSVPHMGEGELGYVTEAFSTNWLSTVGPNLEAFEAAFTARMGLPSVALASGTAAIHLGLRLLGVGPGDEVICPSLTFIASVNPALYLGARPVFIDSTPDSWNLDPALLDDFLSKRRREGRVPRALIVVHLYGQSADMDPILETCARHGVAVLEDAAEAVGTLYKGRPAGTLAPIGAYSFNGNKIITTSGGGMLVAHDKAQVDLVRFWSQQARDPGIAYEHTQMGYNYRMSNVLAGMGRGQLEVLDQRVARRRAVAFAYAEAFKDLEGLSLMPQASYGLHTNWLSTFSVDAATLGTDRDALIKALAAEDIESRPVWKPMHLQPLFAGVECVGGAVAERCFFNGICLPSSTNMRDDDQARVIETVRRTVARGRSRSRSVSDASA
ncbi:MAG: DegT/DnrJ/EryC1/StrS family aminotransferase [Myxococcales bacterium]|nr:DegT/DnrJ/EryC1/StrS family aminotransferase [Myxococcales bacterium]